MERPIKGELSKQKVIIKNEPRAVKLAQKGFGAFENNKLELSLVEALFLVEKGDIEVRKGGTRATPENIMEAAKDEDFLNKYKVYKDLRERGLVVKTGFKFGAHFRVYERGKFQKNEHSTFLVHVVRESDKMSFSELARAVRLAVGVKKTMIFAIADEEGDISYYQTLRFLP